MAEVIKPAESPTPRAKRFREYFYDFLVSAIAIVITLGTGLLIDNCKDKHKERDYMCSMINDLEVDMGNCDYAWRHKEEQVKNAALLVSALKDHKVPAQTNGIYKAARLIIPKTAFYIRDGTFQQLKSGGLQLIRQQAIVDSIYAYIGQLDGVQDLQAIEDVQTNDYCHIVAKVFRSADFSSMTDPATIDLVAPQGDPTLFSTNEADINELVIITSLLERNEHNEVVSLKALSEKAKNLIRQIKKEYNL